MSDTTLNGGSVRILWDASSSAVVNITGNGNPSFTVNGSAVTFPYTLNSSTTFDTIHTGDYIVSVQHNGIEVAETPDGTKNVRLSGGGQVIFNPTVDGGGRGKNLLDELSGSYVQVDKYALDARKYGVLADGTADDTAALTDAITIAASPFGKSSVVLMPPGTTLVSGIDVPTGVTLRGHALGSRIKLKNGSNRPVIRTATLTTQAVRVENLTVDGNKANQSGGVSHGIHLNNTETTITPAIETYLGDCYHRVSDVLIINCDGSGLRTDGRGETEIRSTRSFFNTADGFRINSFDTWVDACSAGGNTGHGFNVTNANVSLTACKGFMNANGLRLNAFGAIVSDFVGQGNTNDGVLLDGARDSIVSALCLDNNYLQNATAATGHAVRAINGATRNQVKVAAYNVETPARQQGAIYVTSTGNTFDVTVDTTQPLLSSGSNARGNVVRSNASGGFAVDTFAASYAPDIATGNIRQVTLTGNITMGRPVRAGSTTIVEGQTLTLVFTQDATGGRTVTWGSGWIDKKWQPNPAASSTSSVTWRYWGGNWTLEGGHYPATALTAADASTVDTTYGTEEAAVINNLRTRVNALEALLQKQGLLL